MPVHTSPRNDQDLGFDRAALLLLVGDDRELLRDIVKLFLESAPPLLKEIGDAVAVADGERVELAAHALRGAAKNFYVRKLEDAAWGLEQLGLNRNLADAVVAYAKLKAEFQKVRALLRTVVAEECHHDDSDRGR